MVRQNESKMKIAICEDNDLDAAQLADTLRKLEGFSGADRYTCAEQLLEAYASGARFDLIIMDIRLPGRNGFEAAKQIHGEYVDERPLVAFLTITDQYVYEGYSIGCAYLRKPITIEDISPLFDMVQAETAHRYVFIETPDGTMRFRTKDIYYIEASYGVVKIVTAEAVHDIRTTLDKIHGLLGGRPFCMVHRSYIVNLRHVARYDQKQVYLPDGNGIPLSRKKREPFRESLELYCRSHYD
ncbi:MAG: LytTR family DNA-binding domain-containing protein [Clostridiales bacterium]|nr:LytTR family DNA-binding domain-containing protein [Clostridiales bacterium]